jgi:hypothetical protein
MYELEVGRVLSNNVKGMALGRGQVLLLKKEMLVLDY